MEHKQSKIHLTDVNEFITCVLCKGYLIDATTITECLHTFCKQCIVNYLEDNCTCPICNTLLHQSHPYLYIAHDRTMQAIVYSLVSDLEKNELERQVNFYKDQNLEYPPALKEKLDKNSQINENNVQNNNNNKNKDKEDAHRFDEQISLCLEPLDGLDKLPKQYILCSCNSTVTTLKKFVALKIYSNLEQYKELDIVLDDEPLGKDHTLRFIQVTFGKDKEQMLHLNFRPKIIYN